MQTGADGTEPLTLQLVGDLLYPLQLQPLVLLTGTTGSVLVLQSKKGGE